MVHQYINNGLHIVLDVHSGSIHLVDEVVYDLIPAVENALQDLFGSAAGSPEREVSADALLASVTRDTDLGERYPHSELTEGIEEILSLRAAETLFADDAYADAVETFEHRETVVKALCLNIAHDCNLRCAYCFADEGAYHGDRRGLMSLEVGKAALDFLVAHSGNRRNLEVDFFGGEPLLNWPVVKALVEYGRSIEAEHHKNFRFTLTTNGTLLNEEILQFVNREMGNIVLSIDGRKEINDRMRPRAGGQGTYDDIVPKFLEVAKSRHGVRYFVRGTFTHANLDFSEDVRHLADLGFTQISVEPVVASPDDWYAIREEDVPELCAEYDRLAQLYLERRREGRPFHFFHFNIDLEGGPCVAKRLSGCGSGCEYLGVTPWGELYPCHQFVGNRDFLMGNVFEGITRTDIADRFRASNVYTRPECAGCFARYYCSGGCAANAWNFTGSIDGNYAVGCALERKRVECAIMIKAVEAMEKGEEVS